MTQQKNAPHRMETTMKNVPTHAVYLVREGREKDGAESQDVWTKIGAAWPHKDGKGFGLTFDGRMVLRASAFERRADRTRTEHAE